MIPHGHFPPPTLICHASSLCASTTIPRVFRCLFLPARAHRANRRVFYYFTRRTLMNGILKKENDRPLVLIGDVYFLGELDNFPSYFGKILPD